MSPRQRSGSSRKTLKYEESCGNEYRDYKKSQACIRDSLDRVCNRKRLHSAPGNLPPAGAESAFIGRVQRPSITRARSRAFSQLTGHCEFLAIDCERRIVTTPFQLAGNFCHRLRGAVTRATSPTPHACACAFLHDGPADWRSQEGFTQRSSSQLSSTKCDNGSSLSKSLQNSPRDPAGKALNT